MVSINMEIKHSLPYSLPLTNAEGLELVKDWGSIKPQWFEVVLPEVPGGYIPLPDPNCGPCVSEILVWLEENIADPLVNVRWMPVENFYFGNGSGPASTVDVKIKFKYEQDYMWFKLVWQ